MNEVGGVIIGQKSSINYKVVVGKLGVKIGAAVGNWFVFPLIYFKVYYAYSSRRPNEYIHSKYIFQALVLDCSHNNILMLSSLTHYCLGHIQ